MTSDRPIVLIARAAAICHTLRSRLRDRGPPIGMGLRARVPSPAFLACGGALQRRAMPMRLERCYRFEAAHLLPKVPVGHKCARMHGHSYQIEIAIEGDLDGELGWVMDFAEID